MVAVNMEAGPNKLLLLKTSKNEFVWRLAMKIEISIKILKRLRHLAFKYKEKKGRGPSEWGWTAQNSIARQSFARRFWQQINCSTQNLSTARIQLILAKPDSSKWQKMCQLLNTVKCVNCSTLSSSWHFFLVWHINWKSQFFTYRNGQ